MTEFTLREEVHTALDGTRFELGALGLFCHRNGAAPGVLEAAESALAAHGSVRVFDFTHGARYLAENVVPADGADPAAYEGVLAGSGHRIFRVDHHYEVGSLSSVSTTPLVLQWIRGLWRRGCKELLAQVAGSRYLADHADTDILLSNYVAIEAMNDAVVHGPLGRWFAAAALRNDYVRLPVQEDEPYASRIFYACVGIEADVLEGALGFGEAQGQILPHLGSWVTGDAGKIEPEVGRRLDEWNDRMRQKEAWTLGQIATWERDGRLTWDLDGRLAILEAEQKVDNADLYLYFVRKGQTPVVQALVFPEPGERVTMKLRAHGGFDLNRAYGMLNAIAPQARFGGRAAAGGSKPTQRLERADFVKVLGRALGDGHHDGGSSSE